MPRRLPSILLILALSLLFALGTDRGYFHHILEVHNSESAKSLALAENLSLEHRWRLFTRLCLDASGAPRYEMHSRLPIGGYALVKLALLPFDGDLSAKIAAARALMLALFCAAAALAFHALCRIAAEPWVALGATLLAFSSYRLLIFSDAVSAELSVDLFATMLVFHGMAIHAQQGRFGQLAAKTCVALLLGWHVYGLLSAFIVLGLGFTAVDTWRARCADEERSRLVRLGAVAGTLGRSRCLALGALALLFGAAVLSFNLVNEPPAYADEPPPAPALPHSPEHVDAPLAARSEQSLPEQPLFRQFHRLGTEIVPFALPAPRDAKGRLARDGPMGVLIAGIGALAVGACLIWLPRARLARQTKMLLGVLVLSGFGGALPVHRNAALHDYESWFCVGVPLALFALILMHIRQRRGRGVVANTAIVAAIVFGLSGFKADRLASDAQQAELQEKVMADFDRLRETTRGKTVFVAQTATAHASPSAIAFYLPGSILQYESTERLVARDRSTAGRNFAYDFIVGGKDFSDLRQLTPRNKSVFLYDAAPFATARDFHFYLEYRTIASSEPLARSEFDIHLRAGELIYLKSPCTAEDTRTIFFVHAVPTRLDNLSAQEKEQGFNNLDFHFADHGAMFAGKCIASVRLPDYAFSTIATGRYVPGEGEKWRVHIAVGGVGRVPDR